MALVNPHDHPPLKVLVVEDDASTRVLLRKVLEKDGFQIVTAQDGEEGLALFMTQAPDMVVTDCAMPGMTGGELIRRIQAHLKDGGDIKPRPPRTRSVPWGRGVPSPDRRGPA